MKGPKLLLISAIPTVLLAICNYIFIKHIVILCFTTLAYYALFVRIIDSIYNIIKDKKNSRKNICLIVMAISAIIIVFCISMLSNSTIYYNMHMQIYGIIVIALVVLVVVNLAYLIGTK